MLTGDTRPLAPGRISRAFLANLANYAARIAVPFVSLPIFFASWDADRVGAWMLLFAAPAYLTLFGIGFTSAGGNRALSAAKQGDFDAARREFVSARRIAMIGTVALCAAVILPPILSDLFKPDAFAAIGAGEWGLTLLFLALYVIAVSHLVLLEIPFRAVGRYPDHILLTSFATLVEILAIALAVTASTSFAWLALSLALFRTLVAGLASLLARRAAPAMFARGVPTNGEIARFASLRSSLGFIILPLVLGLNLQGYALAVGAIYGLVALAGFVATRAFARVIVLLSSLTYAMQFYEAGYLERDSHAIQRRLLASMTLVTILSCALFIAALLLAGPALQALITLGKTSFDPALAIVLALAGSVHALAASPFAVIAARNRHFAIAVSYLAGSVLALAAGIGLGLVGAPPWLALCPLVAAELCQLLPAFRAALAELDYPAAVFLRDLASRDRIRDFSRIAHRLFTRRQPTD